LKALSEVAATLPGRAGDVLGVGELLRVAFSDTSRLLIIKQISDIEDIGPDKYPPPAEITQAIDSIFNNQYIKTDITLFTRAKKAFDALRKATDFKGNKLLKQRVDKLYSHLFENEEVLKGVKTLDYHLSKARSMK